MALPAEFAKQIQRLEDAYAQVAEAIPQQDVGQAAAAFAQFGQALNAVDGSLLTGHPRMQWKEFAMLLGNDVVEGRAAQQLAEADRVFLLLKGHMRRMREQLGVVAEEETHLERIVVSPAFQSDLARVWEQYLALGQALAADNLQDAQKVLAGFESAVAAIDDKTMIDKVIRFLPGKQAVVALLVVAVVAGARWWRRSIGTSAGCRAIPYPTDAIPDIGENQQIVFTEWMGRSPQDVEDQITYPLTVSLLGVPGVKTVRSYSMFGFSTIYVIFKEDVEFYWSRTRVLEKLNSLPAGTLPEGVTADARPRCDAAGPGLLVYAGRPRSRRQPGRRLGPGRAAHRSGLVRALFAAVGAEGISEVASVGGFVQEYQIDVDPDAMRAARVTFDDIFMAVKKSNIDVGARTIEISKAEYFIRGLGFVENVEDIEYSVVPSTTTCRSTSRTWPP
jgi:hypothetical protein